MKEPQIILGTVATSWGNFGAVISPKGVSRLTFPTEPFEQCKAWCERWMPEAAVVPTGSLLDHLADELNGYLAGRLHAFTIPVDLQGTAFQVAVWSVLQHIPYGATCSYAHVAREIGNPKAVRAVGAANGANPIPIIVPCHRVIGSNGQLIGYGGGLDLKLSLLQLEGARVA